MARAFLYCAACGDVGRESRPAFGFTPGFEEAGPEGAAGEGDFERRHAGHGLRRLRVSPEAYVSEAAYGAEAPLAFQAVEGGEGGRQVLEARRDAPGGPVAYRLRQGALVRTRQSIGVDPSAIASVVADAAGRPVDAAVVEAAAILAGIVAAEAGAAGFASLESTAVAGATPLVAHAPLPDAVLPRLFDAARRLVAEGALGAGRPSLSPRVVARLLELNAGPGGAFAPTLETGYALVGASGAVEGYVRRIRARAPAATPR